MQNLCGQNELTANRKLTQIMKLFTVVIQMQDGY